MSEKCEVCNHILTDEQVDRIAEHAAKMAIELSKKHLYEEVGKKAINGFVYLVGIVVVGLSGYFHFKA